MNPPAGRPPPRIVYIDDDEALVELFVLQMRRRGYVVAGYVDAAEAMGELRRAPRACDAVVTDYHMPAMSGIDVARHVLRLRPNLPVMIATTSITPSMRDAAAAAGVRAVVLKANAVEAVATILAKLRRRRRP